MFTIKKEYIRIEEMKDLFSLVPLLKSMKQSLDAEHKRLSEYTDAETDCIDSFAFNHIISDMPHSNTNNISSPTESAAALYESKSKIERKEAIQEINREIYFLDTIISKIEIGLNGLSEFQRELLKLKFWEEKTWNEIIFQIQTDKKFYSKRQIQDIVKKAISKVNIIAMITIDNYKTVKTLTHRETE